MSGPPPKPPEIRARRNRVATAADLVDTNPVPTGKVPPLAKRRDTAGQLIPWSAEIRKWWGKIWLSPMAAKWTRSDIDGLLMLAALRELFNSRPSVALASEIRLQEARFGLDPISRRRLQWAIKPESRPSTNSEPASSAGADPRRTLRAVK